LLDTLLDSTMHLELTRFFDDELTDAEPVDESGDDDDSSDSSDGDFNETEE
jgi:hypothetical protein